MVKKAFENKEIEQEYFVKMIDKIDQLKGVWNFK